MKRRKYLDSISNTALQMIFLDHRTSYNVLMIVSEVRQLICARSHTLPATHISLFRDSALGITRPWRMGSNYPVCARWILEMQRPSVSLFEDCEPFGSYRLEDEGKYQICTVY
jgi:hypothetical protein